MIPQPVLSYEERRQELSLLERLTAQARLELARAASQIRATPVEASEEGVLIAEILGILLFLLLVGGMLLFFHKETRWAAECRRRLRRASHWLLKTVRRTVFRFDREWSCQEDADNSSDVSGPGVYRGMPDDVTEVELPPPPSETFDHRNALLELFADLELHHEVVCHNLRNYNTALSPLNDQAAPPARSNPAQMSPLAQSGSVKLTPRSRPGSVKVAPLPGILRVPTQAFGGRGHHRHHRHHRHHSHHYHHHHKYCETIGEKHQQKTYQHNGGVTTEPNDDLTARRSSLIGENDGVKSEQNTAGVSENVTSEMSLGESGEGDGCEGVASDSVHIVVQDKGASSGILGTAV